MTGVAEVADAALECLVVPSFTRVGIAARRRLYHWPESEADDLTGRVIAISGVTSGLGLAAATQLAARGATVVAIGRDRDRTEGAVAGIREGTGNSEVIATIADLADLDAVRGAAAAIQRDHDRLDVLVHNAGVTRDRTIAKMPADRWDGLVDINLSSEERINDALLDGVLAENGRIVCVSSLSGIAGNAGQTNYATSKAGVIGMVEALEPVLRERGQTINAVAPGFIETTMTAQMPLALREAGRRMNSLRQGGLPVDVAETVAFFASPAAAGVNGNVVRVCGQSLLGA